MSVTNLFDGIDVYELYRETSRGRIMSEVIQTFPLPHMKTNIVLPIQYIEGSKALLCGSSAGYASIRNSETGEVIQTLEHSGM